MDEASLVAPLPVSIQPVSRPGLGVAVNESETGRHHADDLDGLIVELHHAADGTRIGGESLLPAFMAEHGDHRRIRPVVVLRDRSSELRRNAE